MGTSYDNLMAEKNFLPYRMGYLTDWMVQLAEKDLNETEKNRNQSLSELRKLIAKEKDLNVWTDDAYLLQYLRARKFNVKRTWDLLRHHYVVKRDNPEVYPPEPDIDAIKQFLLESDVGGTYPYRDKNGSSILFFKACRWDPDKYPVTLAISTLTFGIIQTVEDPASQVCGIQLLIDAEGISLKHVRSLTPRYIKLLSQALKNTWPVSFRGIHIVNESVFVTYIFSALKLFLPEKIKNRFHFHGSDMKHLHKYIPKEILPSEYEGDNTNFCAMEWNKKEMFPFFEKYRAMHQLGFR